MKSIELTEAQAEILSKGGPEADALASQLRREAQAEANRSKQTVEIYHPEGYVWDARSANE